MVQNPGFKNGQRPFLEGPIEVKVPIYTESDENLDANAPAKGNLGGIAGRISTLSGRLMNAHINIVPNSNPNDKDFRFFTTHAVFVNNNGVVDPNNLNDRDRMAIRWYKIKDLATDTPVVELMGNIFEDATNNPRWFYMPSIMTNKRGDIVVCSSTSAENQFIDAVCFRRFVGDPSGPSLEGFPTGKMREPVFLTNADASYNYLFDSSQGQRWGDYSNTSLDFCDNMTMWTIQEFCPVTDGWGCQVAEVKAPSPIPPFPQPCSN